MGPAPPVPALGRGVWDSEREGRRVFGELDFFGFLFIVFLVFWFLRSF